MCMEKLDELRQAIHALQEQLAAEAAKRADLERRCHILEKLAYRDPATGLRTETYLRNRIREEIERSTRYPSATTLITLYAPGHNVPDEPGFGELIIEALRASDHIFALNSGGLAILLVETAEDGAQIVLDRLRSEMKPLGNGTRYSVTCFPEEANLPDDFLSLAMRRHADLLAATGAAKGAADN